MTLFYVERGEEAQAILMKDRVKLFVEMESEQESMTMRTIRSNSGGGTAGSSLSYDRASASGAGIVGFGRSPGYASISSATRSQFEFNLLQYLFVYDLMTRVIPTAARDPRQVRAVSHRSP